MITLDQEAIIRHLDYEELINQLRQAFTAGNITVPERMHLNLPNNNISLVMPAWNEEYYGLKQIIACPSNPQNNLPIIQGKYALFNVKNGVHLAEINAPKLTSIRTAATSVLAASLIKKSAKTLVILGAGVIAEELVKCYHAKYELEKIIIWNRTHEKAVLLVSRLESLYPVFISANLEQECNDADIISCATHTTEPVLKGEWINGKTHIDLIGSYKSNMREVDDALISKTEIYIDSEKAIQESGDLFIPIESGVINKDDIKGTLFELCRGEISVEAYSIRPTIFKSVGHAIEDLAAAIYLYEKIES